jgi:hypothetical protein
MGALPLPVKSKSEQKVDSLPPLGLEPVTFGTQVHLSDRSAKTTLLAYLYFPTGSSRCKFFVHDYKASKTCKQLIATTTENDHNNAKTTKKKQSMQHSSK